MDGSSDTTLLAIIGSLFATGIWVVRTTLARTDNLMASRDKHIETALQAIQDALVDLRESTEAVRRIEHGQHETRGEMIRDIRSIAASQVTILEIQERILRELERMETQRVEE